jgi:hypothetical protein
MTADPSDMNSLSIKVPITNSLERLLKRAAMDRDLTPEALAQRILREWLLAEGGFAQRGSLPERVAGRAGLNGTLTA